MAKLYELSGELLAIQDRLIDGEIDVDTELALESIQGEFDGKAESICKLIRHLQFQADMLTMERNRIMEEAMLPGQKARRLEASVAWLKEYVRRNMEALDMKRLSVGIFDVRRQSNSQPAIRWQGDPADLPPNLRMVQYQLNLPAARDALKRGELPDGFKIDKGEHLRIG